MAGSIAELKAALDEQNRIQQEALAVEREKIRAQMERNRLEQQKQKLDARLIEEQQGLRRDISSVLAVSEELVKLIPMLYKFGDSQVIILAVLELIVQPLHRIVVKGELNGESKEALEQAIRDMAKMRAEIQVYGQIKSGRDTNVAGNEMNTEEDDG